MFYFVQAPGSGFHPHDESVNIYYFLVPPIFNKNVDTERYVSVGLYELSVGNVADLVNEKFRIQNELSLFLSETSLIFFNIL